MEGGILLWELLYSTSHAKLVVLKELLEDDNMSESFIWQLLSCSASPVVFTKKPTRDLMFHIHYSTTNSNITNIWFLIPLIWVIQILLQGAKDSTSLNVPGTKNFCPISDED